MLQREDRAVVREAWYMYLGCTLPGGISTASWRVCDQTRNTTLPLESGACWRDERLGAQDGNLWMNDLSRDVTRPIASLHFRQLTEARFPLR